MKSGEKMAGCFHNIWVGGKLCSIVVITLATAEATMIATEMDRPRMGDRLKERRKMGDNR